MTVRFKRLYAKSAFSSDPGIEINMLDHMKVVYNVSPDACRSQW